MSEGIENKDPKPIFRMDRGSANIAHSTKRLIKDLEMILSFSRVHRPPDNSRQERWYRTIKQEEMYCYPQYESVEVARFCIENYIEYYNEKQPHKPPVLQASL